MRKMFFALLVGIVGVLGTLGVALADPQDPRGPQGQGADKVTVCHETGSDQHPYVTLEVADPASHEGHHGDDGTCPPHDSDDDDDDDGGSHDYPHTFTGFFTGTRTRDASTGAVVLASTK